MPLPAHYISSVFISFSTYLERTRVPETEKTEARRLLQALLDQKADIECWEAKDVESFVSTHSVFSPVAIATVTRFIEKFPPFQVCVYLNQFLLALADDGCSNSTIRNYRSDINQFWLFAKSTDLSKLLKKTVIAQFVANEQAKGLQASSIRRKVAAISQFGLWARRMNLITADVNWMNNPQLLEELQKPSAITKPLEKTHSKDILTTASKPASTINIAPMVPLIPPVATTPTPVTPAVPQEALPIQASSQPTARKTQEHRAQLKEQLDELSHRLRRQSQRMVAPWLTLAAIGLFFLGLGVFGYQQLILNAPRPLAYPNAPVTPNRVLSFQGRLTDTAQNPLTTATDMSFVLYDDENAGNILWDSGTCSITPDQDGIFNSALGDTCGAAIPASVFSENSNVWLEVSVESETLTPRQPIWTVPYALNSETIQGYPISASGAATANTVVTMDGSGDIVLGEVSPEIRSTSGNFTITGQSLLLQTQNNGNIILDAHGTGATFIRDYLSAPGATLSATYAGGVPLTLRGGPSGSANILDIQDNSGNTLSSFSSLGNLTVGPNAGTTAAFFFIKSNVDATYASLTASGSGSNTTLITPYIFRATTLQASTLTTAGTNQALLIDPNGTGTINFHSTSNSIDASGNLTLSSLNTPGGIVYAQSGGLLAITAAGTSSDCLLSGGTGTPTWGSCAGAVSSSIPWQVTNGTANLKNTTLDLLVGGNSSASAKFAVLNINSGTPTASIAGSVSGAGTYITGDGTIATTNNRSLLLNPTGGNVGIGTTNPRTALELGSGQFSLPSGSVSAPSLTFGNDLDTGIYHVGSDNLNIAVGGVEVGTFTSSGLRVGANNTGRALISSSLPTSTLPVFTFNADTDTGLGRAGADIASIIAGGVNVLNANSSGLVGIGTTAPASLLDVRRTSTTFPTYGMGYFDWSPSSATATTGDLFSLNVGANGTVGNIFAVKNNGSTVFSVSQSQITNNLPTQFTSGDVAIGYDINLTNPTASYIRSVAPLYIQAGEVFNSSDLTLRTFNSGNIVLDSPGGVTLAQAQNWTLASSSAALNFQNGLLTLDTTNSRVGIGTSAPAALLAVGGSNQFQVNTSGQISAPTDETINGIDISAGAISDVTDFTASGTITLSSLNTAGGIVYTNGSGVLSTSAAGTTSDCLLSGGTGAPTWGSCASAVATSILWQESAGTAQLKNTTLDLLVGGTSTTSAKFAFLNVNSGTPTASIAGTTTGAATYITGNGTIATTNSRSLHINPTGGNVGIGTTSTLYPLQVGNNLGSQILSLAGGSSVSDESGIRITESANTEGFALMMNASGNTFHIQNLNSSATGTNIMTFFKRENNVAIGTTAAASQLVVNGAYKGNALVTFNATGSNDIFTASGSGTPRFVITQAGNVGIGTTNPSAALHVVGNITSPGVGTSSEKFGYGAVADPDQSLAVGNNARSLAGSGSIAIGYDSLAQGAGTSAAIAIGSGARATVYRAVAIGSGAQSSGDTSLAILGSASGGSAIAIGRGAQSAYNSSVALGYEARATDAQQFIIGGKDLAGWNIKDMYLGGVTLQNMVDVSINAPGANGTNLAGGSMILAAGRGTGTGSGGSLQFQTANSGSSGSTLNPLTTKMTITANGNVGIGTTTPIAKLQLTGSAAAGGNALAIFNNTSSSDIFAASASGTTRFVIDTNGQVLASQFSDLQNSSFYLDPAGTTSLNVAGALIAGTDETINGVDISAGAISDVTNLSASGTITFSGFSNNGGLLYTNGSGVLAQTAVGSTGDCLLSAGGGSPAWGSCSGAVASSILWQESAGTAQLKNTTLDLLVGGTSTASAKFAFLNVNSGTPTASIAGTTSGAGLYMTGEGTISTTNNRSLLLNPNGGNVGIGTTNPAAPLSFSTNTGAPTSTPNKIQLYPGLGYGFGVSSGSLDYQSAGVHSWYTNSTSLKMTLDSNGQLGIGTSSPRALLDVEGGASLSGTLAFRGTTDPKIDILNGEAFGIRTSSHGDGGLFERFTVLNNGRIGIGTSSPNSNLQGVSPTNFVAYLDGNQSLTESVGAIYLRGRYVGGNTQLFLSSGGSNAYVQATGGNDLIIQHASAGNGVSFYDNSTQIIMRMRNNGLVSIGTTNALSTFDVRGKTGTISAASISAQTSVATMFVDNSGTGDIFTASKSGSTKFVITNAGNVGIGTTLAATPLDVNGYATIADSVSSGRIYFGRGSTYGFGGSNPQYLRTNAGAYYFTGLAGEELTLDLNAGGSSTMSFAQGNVLLNANAGSANLQLQTQGTTRLTVGSSGDLTATGAISGLTGITSSGTITFSGFSNNGGLLYTNGSGVLAQTAVGNADECLLSAGGGAPAWGSCSGAVASSILWQESAGTAQLKNTTLDMLVGGTSTASAKFAFLNVNSGTPTASIAGTTSGAGLYMTGEGTISTTNSRSLFLNPNGGRVGIGTTTANYALDVLGGINLSDFSTGLRMGGNRIAYRDGVALYMGAVDGSSPVRIRAAGGDAITLTGTAVGIGTTSPTAFLDVAGSASLSGTISFRGTTDPQINALNSESIAIQVSPGGDAGLTSRATFNPAGIQLYGRRSEGTNANIMNIGGGVTGVNINPNKFGASDTYTILNVNGGSVDNLFMVYGNGRDKVTIGGSDTTSSIRAHVLTATTNYVGLAVEGSAGQTADLQQWQDSSGNALAKINSNGYFFAPGATISATYAAGVPLTLVGGPSGTGSIQEWKISGGGTYSAAVDADGTFVTRAGTGFQLNNGRLFELTGNSSAFNIRDASAGETRLTVLSTGEIGIGTTTPASLLSVGSTSQFQVNSSGAIAAATGITSSGTITFSGFSNNGGLLYTNGSGVLAQTAVGNADECLLSAGGGAPAWGSCSGAVASSILWQESAGTAQLKNTTLDMLVGGTSTASAKFAFINVNSGVPTASIAGTTTGAGLYMTGEGTIATTRNRSLALNPSGGNVGIGTTAPTGLLHLVSSTNPILTIQNTAPNTTEGGIVLNRQGTNLHNYLAFQTLGTELFRLGNANDGTNHFYFRDGSNNVITIQDNSPANMLYLNTSGNIGIGTTSPRAKVDIEGGASLSGTLAFRGTTDPKIDILNGENFGIRTGSHGDAGLTERLTILNNGNIGIGASPLYAKVQITGGDQSNIYSNASLAFSYQNTNSYSNFIHSRHNAGTTLNNALDFYTSDGTAASVFPTNAIHNLTLNGGNVGIGTVTPNFRLNVSGVSVAGGNALAVFNSTNSSSDIFAASASGTNRFVITHGGNVGIGTTLPASTLHVNAGAATQLASFTSTSGTIRFETTGSISQFVGYNAAGSSYQAVQLRAGSGSQVVHLATSGNVGIGSTSPGATLDISGTLRASGTITFSGFSNNGGLLYTNGSGVLAQTAVGNADECLLSAGGGSPAWGSCSGAVASSILWQESAGTAQLKNTTLDMLVGGTSTASAKFAFLNVNSGTPTASIAGTTSGAATYITGEGTIATTNNRSLMLNPDGGRVGVGTTNPNATMHIRGYGAAVQTVNAYDSTLTLDSSATAGVDVGPVLRFMGQSGNAANPYTFGWIKGAKENNVAGNYSGYLSFTTVNNAGGYSERMRIGANGNVGIGTTAPVGKLQVTGAAGAGSNALAIFDQTGTGDIFTASDSGTTRFVITEAGNVGIGTSNPGKKLHVVDNAGALRLEGTDHVFLEFYPDGPTTRKGYIGYAAQTDDNLTINNNNTGAHIILLPTATGNVGIGTTSPSNKLQVVGNGTEPLLVNAGIYNDVAAFISTDDEATIRISDDDSSGYINVADSYLSLGGTASLNSTNLNINTSTGNVGIGSTSPSTKLDVAGNARVYDLLFAATDPRVQIESGHLRFVDASNNQLARLTQSGNFGIGSDTTPDAMLSVGSTSQFQVNSSGAIAAATGITSSGTITFSGFSNNGGLLYTNGSGVLAQTAVGSSGECLLSAGGGSPTWGACSDAVAGAVHWEVQNGAANLKNTSLDLLVGGTSTASAKFAVLNVAGGTPTASIAGTTTGAATYITGEGTIATTNNRSLLLNPNGGNVGIGTTTAPSKLTLVDSVTSGSGANFTFNSLTSGSGLNISSSGTAVSGSLVTINQTGNDAANTGAGLTINTGNTFSNSKALVINHLSGGATGAAIIVNDQSTDTTPFIVDNSGNVGIGTTAPNKRLQVDGAPSNALAVSIKGAITTGQWTGLGFGYDQTGGDTYNKAGILYERTDSSARGSLHFATDNTADTSNVDLADVRMTIAADGNVGIGTTIPSQKLEVTGGNIYITDTNGRLYLDTGNNYLSYDGTNMQLVSSSGMNFTSTGFVFNEAGSDADFRVEGDTNTHLLFADAGLDRVGIGQSIPSAKLHITAPGSTVGLKLNNSDASGYMHMQVINNGTQIELGADANNPAYLKTSTNHPLYFGVNNTEMMRILANGNVGIGTSTPVAKLQVTGQQGAGSNALAIFNQTGTGDIFTASDSGTTRFVITEAGNVGIGTTLPTDKLEVVGGNIRLDNQQELRFENTGGSVIGQLRINGSNAFEIVNQGGPITFRNSSSELARFDNTTGNFNIGGDTTPDSLLSVGSTSQFQVNSSGAIAAATGITSSGTITLSAFSNNGGLLYTNGSGVLAQTAVGSSGECLLSAGGGSPTWGACSDAVAGAVHWEVQNGAVNLKNTSLDLLVGGTSTASAKFAVLNVAGGTPTASIAGTTSGAGLYMTGEGTIATTNNRSMLLNPNGGNVGIGTTSASQKLTVAGNLAFDTADRSIYRGTTERVQLTASYTNFLNASVGIGTSAPQYSLDVVGGYVQSRVTNGSATGFLIDNTASPLWGLQAATTGRFELYDFTAGASRFAVATNGNFGIGTTGPVGKFEVAGEAAASGNALAVFNQTGTGDIFTASDSGTTRFVITEAGNVGVGTRNPGFAMSFGSSLHDTGSKLALYESGGSSLYGFGITAGSMNIFTNGTQRMAILSSGNVGVGTTAPAGLFSVGTTSQFQVNSGGQVTAHTDETINGIDINAGAISDVTNLTASGTITFSGLNTAGGIVYTNGSGVLATSAAGSASQCLLSGGTGAPTWGSCSTGAGLSKWNITAGALAPINTTTDLLIGGTSTASAKFAFINVAGGTPTASIAGTTTGAATYITGEGTIATTQNRSLLLNPTGGNVGVGTTNALAKLDVFSSAVNSDVQRWMATDGSRLGRFTETSGGAGWFEVDNATGTAQWLLRGDGGDSYVNGGDFGVGTTAPAGLFSVGSASQFQVDSSGNIQTTGNLAVNGNTTLGDASGDTVTANAAAWTFANDTNFALSGGANGLSFDTDTLSIDASANRVGIGSTSPTARLNVSDSESSDGSYTAVRFQSTKTNSTADTNSATYFQDNQWTLSGANYVGNTIGLHNRVTIANSDTNNTVRSITGRISMTGTGAANNVAALETFFEGGGSGTVTNLKLLNVGSFTNASNTITNTYGIYIDDVTAGTQTNQAYGLYQVDTSARNYFGGNVGIGDTSPAALLTVGTSDAFQVDASGNLTTTGTIVANTNETINGVDINAGAISDVTNLTASGTITLSGLNTAGGVVYTNGSGVLASVAGSSGQCLLSNGTSAPSWGGCSTGAGLSKWNITSGALTPINSTTDLLLGGTATASSRIALTGVNSGNTAITLRNGADVTTLSSTGELTSDTTLNLYTAGGNITLEPDAGAGTVNVLGDINLTTGNEYRINSVNVLNATTLGSSVVNSSLTSVGALSSGSIASGFGTIATTNTITGTTLNGTTGINTGAGAGTQRINSSGALVNITDITASGTITLSGLNTAGGVVYTNGSGVLASVAGSSGQCLLSNGTSAPSWGSCATGTTNYWQLNNTHNLTPGNVSYNVLLGSTATASANIALNADGSAVFNEQGLDRDFRIETDALTHAFFVDASTDRIGFGTSTPAYQAQFHSSASQADFAITTDVNVGSANTTQLAFVSDLNGTPSYASIGQYNTDGLRFSGVGNLVTPDAMIDGSGNFFIGGTAETLANTGFTMDGNDLYVAGMAGIEGGVYTDGSFVAGASTTYGNGSISQSSGETLTMQTTAAALTLQTVTSGNIVLNSAGSIELMDGTNITGSLDVSTTLTAGSSNSFNVNSSGAITAAAGITSSGTITLSGLNTAGGILTTNGSGVLASVAGSTGQCLISNGTSAPSWGSCTSGSGGGYWNLASGTIFPVNSTLDLLVGGTSTASADFAFTNINSGTPTLTTTGNIIAGQVNGTTSINTGAGTGTQRIDANGNFTNIRSINKGSTIPTTNDFGFYSEGVNNWVRFVSNNGKYSWYSNYTNGIDNSPPANSEIMSLDTDGALDVNGELQIGDNNDFFITEDGEITRIEGVAHSILDVSGDLTITSNSTNIDLADNVVITGGITASGLNTAGGVVYTNGSGVLASVAGSAGQCLLSNGTSAPSWGSCGSGGSSTSFWNLTSGVIHPVNSTADIMIGGTSTASAKFAFKNVNSGTPTLTIAGNLALGTTAPIAKFEVDGAPSAGGNALAIFNNTSSSDILTASASGTTRFRVDTNGNVLASQFSDLQNSSFYLDPAGTTSLNVAGAIISADTITGTVLNGTTGINTGASAGTQRINASGDLLNIRAITSSGTAPTTIDLGLYSSGSTNWMRFTTNSGDFKWFSNYTNGTDAAPSAGQEIMTLTSGGVLDVNGGVQLGASDAFIVNSTGLITKVDGVAHTIDDISGDLRLTSNSSTVRILDALNVDRDLIVDTSTFIVDATTNEVNVGGDTTPDGLFTVGSSSEFTVAADGNISKIGGAAHYIMDDGSGNLHIQPSGSGIELNGAVQIFNGLTVSSLNTAGGVLVSNGSGVISSVAGSATQCLISNGTSAPSWGSCGGGGGGSSNWTVTAGALHPLNSTTDLLIGGTSTASADFAFTNINSGTPTLTTTGNIAAGAVNGTTSVNTGAGSGTVRIDANGNFLNLRSINKGSTVPTTSDFGFYSEGANNWVRNVSNNGRFRWWSDYADGIDNSPPTDSEILSLETNGELDISGALVSGTSDAFQVNSSGIITEIENVAHNISDVSGNLEINSNGTKTIITDDLQVSGNDLLDSSGSTRITLGSTNTFTATTNTFTGTGYFSGSVGIGTSSPTGKLNLDSATAGNTTETLQRWGYGSSSWYLNLNQQHVSGSHIQWNWTDQGGNDLMKFDRGNITIAGGSGATQNVTIGASGGTTTVYGNIVANNVGNISASVRTICYDNATNTILKSGSNGASCAVSSARYKQNIATTEYGLDTVLQLHPVHFNYKPEYDDGTNQRVLGFIAEEMESVVPEGVFYNDAGLVNGVYYDRIVPIAIKAIQELNSKVDTQIASASGNQNWTISQLGVLNLTEQTNNTYTVATPTGSTVTQLSAFANSVIGNLRAGMINAQKVVTTSLVALQRIETPEVNTNLISPVGDNDLTIGLEGTQGSNPASALNITGTNDNVVASIDGDGNMTLAGQLLAQDISTATLSAESVVTEEIDATSARIALLEANMAELENIRANTAEIVNATVSGTLYADQIFAFQDKVANALKQPTLLEQLMGDIPQASSSTSLAALTQIVDVSPEFASGSAALNKTLADLELGQEDVVLGSAALFVNEYFELNGSGYIAQSLGIGESLLIGQGTMIQDGRFEYIASSDPSATLLQIQSHGYGSINLLAGLMTLDDTGLVTINGDLNVAGSVKTETLLTNLITSTDFTNPFQVQVAGAATESGEVTESRFEIINELGTPVATISAQGKAEFAGGIGVGAEDISGAQGQITTTKTSGKATVAAGTNEVTIYANQVTSDSLIYVTPLSSTGNKVLYVKQQIADNPATPENDSAFVVGFDNVADQAVQFNWWIVN